MDSGLENYLNLHEIKYEEFMHPAVFTVSESRNLKQKIPGLHCKCLFLKSKEEKFYLVAMPAEKRLDMRKLCILLGVKKLNFGSPDELKENLSLSPGSVSVFGMINSTEVILIIDKEVWDARQVGFHPNINTSTLVLSHYSLAKFYESLNSQKQILSL